MDNSHVLDLVTVGIAVIVLVGGFLMMFTTIFTTKGR